jgi:uncharacterized glyoxalase superfamily protein PhnB
MRLTIFNLFVNDQEQAMRFYVEKLGFVVAENAVLGEDRWLLVRASGGPDVALSLTAAKTAEDRALVGRQGGGQPLLGITTDDCRRDYRTLKARGVEFEGEPASMPYGTGVMFRDLYGNKIYMNQD